MRKRYFKKRPALLSKFFSITGFIAVLFFCANTGAGSDPSETLSIGLGGDGQVTFHNPANNEHKSFVYRDDDGVYDTRVFEEISIFFRCKLTGQKHFIDPQLIELLDAVEDHFHAHAVDLISAYRSPTRNALMRRQGRRVAKDSLHMFGQAADIKIRGVSPASIRDFAFILGQGGVGYYGSRNFVHLDTGKQRVWGFRPNNALRNKATLNK